LGLFIGEGISNIDGLAAKIGAPTVYEICGEPILGGIDGNTIVEAAPKKNHQSYRGIRRKLDLFLDRCCSRLLRLMQNQSKAAMAADAATPSIMRPTIVLIGVDAADGEFPDEPYEVVTFVLVEEDVVFTLHILELYPEDCCEGAIIESILW